MTSHGTSQLMVPRNRFASQHPPHEADGLDALIIAGDGNAHELQWRVCVAERIHGDVDVGSLHDELVVSGGVSHHEETSLMESSLGCKAWTMEWIPGTL